MPFLSVVLIMPIFDFYTISFFSRLKFDFDCSTALALMSIPISMFRYHQDKSSCLITCLIFTFIQTVDSENCESFKNFMGINIKKNIFIHISTEPRVDSFGSKLHLKMKILDFAESDHLDVTSLGGQ